VASRAIEAGREDHSVSAAGGSVTAGQAVHASGATDSATALHAVDLTLSFGQKVILSDINAAVRRGAITALIGPTGSRTGAR
jgi:ATPase subunit of ABC transporter with duplicated ATPase domains